MMTKYINSNEIFCLSDNYDVILHREFTDSLKTQELTVCQVVDFLYNMDTYGKNMDPRKKLE